jgi:hypothetical protein
MFERASKKLGMEQALFSSGAFVEKPLSEGDQMKIMNPDIKPDPKDIEKLLKFGAYAFANEEESGDEDEDFKDKKAMALQGLDIDEILAKGKQASFNKG